jgi:hypothetical protein
MSGTPAGAPVNTRRASARAATWSVLMHVSWRAFLVGVVGVALVGALVSSPLATLVVAPAVGGLGALQTAVVHPGFPGRPAARRAVLLSGLGCALVVPFVMGVGALGALGLALTVLLVLIGTVVGMSKISSSCRSVAAPGPGADAALLNELVRGLPTSALLDEWRSSEAVLHETDDPARHAAAIDVRRLLLEEMTRRDPTGVHRWLHAGANGTPDTYIRRDSGPAAH